MDTHVLVWAALDSRELGIETRSLLKDPSVDGWLSSVSALEVSRLVAGGRLELDKPVREWLDVAIDTLRLKVTPLTQDAAVEAHELPAGMHSDPADRMLTATARMEDLILLTADERLLDYPHVPTYDARH